MSKSDNQDIATLLQKGFDMHQSGHLDEARVIYKKILAKNPRHFDALQLLGALHLQAKEFLVAINFFNRAININPLNAGAFNNKGIALKNLNLRNEAIASYDKAIQIEPDFTDAMYNRGCIFLELNIFDKALNDFDNVIDLEKNHTEAHCNRGLTLFRMKKFDEALQSCSEAIRINPQCAEAWNNCGMIQHEIHLDQEAIKSYSHAIQLKPTLPETWSNLGLALAELKKYEEAISSYNQAIHKKSNFYEAITNRSLAENASHLFLESLESSNQAIQIEPKYAQAWFAKAGALRNLNRNQESLAAYNNAIQLNPHYIEAWTNKGLLLSDLKCYQEALASYQKAIALSPNYAEALLNCGVMQLHNLSFVDGWLGFEARWQNKDFNSKPLITTKPIWKGEKNEGRLLIWAEQGIGDQILYGSLFQELVQFPQKKIIFLNSKLIPIFKRSFPEFLFLEGDQIYHEDLYDEQIPIGSLGQFFRKNKEDFKNATHPYLLDDPIKTQHIKSLPQFSNKKTCGISWRSSNQKLGKDKSVLLLDLLPILSSNDMQFINLQYGDTAKEVTDLMEEHGQSIYSVPEVDIFNNIDGVLSIISACDLIITTSNSTAHLAGALGKETLLLVPYSVGKFWYWHDIDGLSLWYPSVRVFQQKTQGDWETPIHEMKSYLERKNG